MPTSDPRKRFSTRVNDYVRYRPSYPHAIIPYLRKEAALTSKTVVADLGSGTGIFCELLLANGNHVYGVEPNEGMRQVAEERFSEEPNFLSVAASAEETTLPDRSIDMVTAAQSFHWFNRAKTRAELARILKKGGPVVLVWNARLTDANAYQREYERFLDRFATDYHAVNHVNVEKGELAAFFSPQGFSAHAIPNHQILDFEGLRGRVESSSYIPGPESAVHREMIEELKRLFDRHQVNGRVRIDYRTNVYVGAVS